MRQIELILKRNYTNSGNGETIGAIYAKGSKNVICETLERPRYFKGKENVRDNTKTEFNESCCIPEGVYLVKWTYSNSFKTCTYEIFGVNSRDGIRIHAANVSSQLRGCIAGCMKILFSMPKFTKVKYLATDKVWADASIKGLQALYAHVGKDQDGKPRDFTLTITS